jgi:predicted nucleic acid-binding protein
MVLDANIPVRAVFWIRVFQLIETYEEDTTFCCPDVCVEEAKQHIPRIAKLRGDDATIVLNALDRLATFLQVVDRSLYGQLEESARARISARDPDNWPIVATALLLNAPIWTEDRDFFGSGIATWTTDRIEIYFRTS